jgi:hypothetical protein
MRNCEKEASRAPTIIDEDIFSEDDALAIHPVCQSGKYD